MYYIYRTTNLINGKTYIGQHKYTHLSDKYLGSGFLLCKAIKKYGRKNFFKEILYSGIQYKETADSVEKFAIKKERAIGKSEYNIADGGQGGFLGNDIENKRLKKLHSKEFKELQSRLNKGENNPFYGKHHTVETLEELSKWRKENVSNDFRYVQSHNCYKSKWYTNGSENIRLHDDDEIPEGYYHGRTVSEEQINKLQENNKKYVTRNEKGQWCRK